MDPEKDVLGFIGIGVMGSSMAGHLLKAGYRLRVHTRTKEKARTLIEAGATGTRAPSASPLGASAILTMVGYPADVEEPLLRPERPHRERDAGRLSSWTARPPGPISRGAFRAPRGRRAWRPSTRRFPAETSAPGTAA